MLYIYKFKNNILFLLLSYYILNKHFNTYSFLNHYHKNKSMSIRKKYTFALQYVFNLNFNNYCINNNINLKKDIITLKKEYNNPIFNEIVSKLEGFGYNFKNDEESKIFLKFINIISTSKIDCLTEKFLEEYEIFDDMYLQNQNWLQNNSKIIYNWIKKNKYKRFVIEKGIFGGIDVYIYDPKTYNPAKIFTDYRLNLYFKNKSKNNDYIRISKINNNTDAINLSLTTGKIIKKMQHDFNILFSTSDIIEINNKLTKIKINDKIKLDLFKQENNNTIEILKIKDNSDLINTKNCFFIEVLDNGFLSKTNDYNPQVIFDKIEFNNSTILKFFINNNIIKCTLLKK